PKQSSSYSSFNAESFKDGSTYKFAAWKSGTYTTLVVLTAVGDKFNDESRFAVVRKAASATETYDGDEVDSVIVLYNGEAEAELFFNKELYADSGLGVGDAFFFETDNDGFVSDVFIVYDHDADAGSKFITLADAITASGFNVDDYLASDFEGWAYDLSNKEYKDIQLVEGYVISGADYVMTFAEVVSPLTNIDTTKEHKEVGDGGVATFIVDSDCHAYLYDTKNTTVIKTYDKFKNTANVSVLASTGLAKYEENGIYSSDSDMSGDANYAIAMIVDEVVVAVYAIK
ncbi:MAG: hypothetical protein J6C82_08575, partial [Clostridia bacterium]|nr:hypothetical protein [Clostridia bacterium]